MPMRTHAFPRIALAAALLLLAWSAGGRPVGAETKTIPVTGGTLLVPPKLELPAPAPVPRIIVSPGKLELAVGEQRQSLTAAWLLREGRLLVPAQTLADAAGAKLETSAAGDALTFTRGDRLVELAIGSPDALIDGWNPAALDPSNPNVTPVLAGEIPLVPLGFMAAALGIQLDWQVAEAQMGQSPVALPPLRTTAAQSAEPEAALGELQEADQTGLPWGWFRLIGKVVDEAGAPVEGVQIIGQVDPFYRYASFLHLAVPENTFAAVTAADGTYRLELPSGDVYGIQAARPCYAEQRFLSGWGFVADMAISSVSAATALSSPADPGRFILNGEVRDQNNRPINGACVTVALDGGGNRVPLRTGSDGLFKLDWPMWEAMRITIDAPGCLTARYRAPVRFSGGEGGPMLVLGHSGIVAEVDPQTAVYNKLTAEQESAIDAGFGAPGQRLTKRFSVWCGPKPVPPPPKPAPPPPAPVVCQVNYATITVTIPGVFVRVTWLDANAVILAWPAPVQNFRVAPGNYEIELFAPWGLAEDKVTTLGPCGYYRAGGYLRP